MDEWTIFGERLKTELTRQEISYRQFSEMSGITTTTVCRYVNSERIPRASEIVKTANVLGVTCDYLLGLSDNPHKTCKSVIFSKPERNSGRWIYGEHDTAMCDGYRCDKCGFFVPWDYKFTFVDFINDYHFCPGCGEKMVKEGDTE